MSTKINVCARYFLYTRRKDEEYGNVEIKVPTPKF